MIEMYCLICDGLFDNIGNLLCFAVEFRLARAGPRSEATTYEMVCFNGCFRRADAAPRGVKTTNISGLQMLRRSRGREETNPLPVISGNDVVSLLFSVGNYY